jgi:hypothetical protein
MDKFRQVEIWLVVAAEQLNRTFGKQDGDAVNHRIAAAAAGAEDCLLPKLQRSVAYGADERSQILLRECLESCGGARRHSLNSIG